MTMRMVEANLDLAEAHLNVALLSLERVINHELDNGPACSETLRKIDNLDMLYINRRQLVSIQKALGLD